MRGHYEEAPEVATRRALLACARKYAGKYLTDDLIGSEIDRAAEVLVAAALAYAEAVRPPKKRATPRRGTDR